MWGEWICKGQLNSDLCASSNMAAICCELTVSPGWSLPKHSLCGRLTLTNWHILGKSVSEIKFKFLLSLSASKSNHYIRYLTHLILLIQTQKDVQPFSFILGKDCELNSLFISMVQLLKFKLNYLILFNIIKLIIRDNTAQSA